MPVRDAEDFRLRQHGYRPFLIGRCISDDPIQPLEGLIEPAQVADGEGRLYIRIPSVGSINLGLGNVVEDGQGIGVLAVARQLLGLAQPSERERRGVGRQRIDRLPSLAPLAARLGFDRAMVTSP